MKVAIIGAGSIVFCKTLILDTLATPGLQDAEFALMAPSRRRTPHVLAYVQRVIEANGLPARAWVTTDRREAVRGADHMVQEWAPEQVIEALRNLLAHPGAE